MSIDFWTLLLQMANVLVLVGLLQRFLFRPVADATGRRQKLVVQRLDEARQARERAEALKAELETEKAGLADARERTLAEARAVARSEREAILARAAAEAEARLAGVEAQLAEVRRQWKAGLESDASELAIRITKQLLERFPRETLAAAFIEDSCRMLAELPPEQMRIVSEDIRGGPCKVVAAGLNEDLQSRCRRGLERVLGSPVEIEFAEQPSLMAGIELRFRRLVVRNSWSNDLERLQRQLDADGRTRAAV